MAARARSGSWRSLLHRESSACPTRRATTKIGWLQELSCARSTFSGGRERHLSSVLAGSTSVSRSIERLIACGIMQLAMVLGQ
jgi:hypothetical protein